MFRWRIYYGDGSWHEGDPYSAPARNVQMIGVSNPDHNWDLVRSNDYYWYIQDLDSWQGGDVFGLFDYLIEKGPKKVIFGRTISNKDFDALIARVYEELPKLAWRPRERESAGIKP